MKATIIAVDFIKDTDGSFKALEMNTGVGFHPLTASMYTDITPITNFVSNNNITEVNYIGNTGLGNLATSPLTLRDLEGGDYAINASFGLRALGIVNNHFSSSADHTFTMHGTQVGATSVPYIEDSDQKLIIRNTFDGTALVDTQYATTAGGFLDLVHNYCTGSEGVDVPKTFIAPYGEDGTEIYSNLLDSQPQFDTIDSSNLRDNGDGIPNYIVKLNSSTVDSDYQNYPKVYKISTSEELDNLKKSLSAEFVLQEYIYNPDDLQEGKAKTYRIISAIAGANLDSLHFFHPYFVTNHTPIPDTVDYKDDNTVQAWDRPAFTQKLSSLSDGSFGQNILGTNVLVGVDNGDIDPDNLTVDSTLRSLTITGLDLDENSYSTATWSGSFTGDTPGDLNTSVVHSKDNLDTTFISMVLGLSDGSTLEVTPSTELLIVTDDLQHTKFIHAEILNTGDKLVKINHIDPSQPAVVVTINSINTQIRVERAIRLDVETTDTFLLKGGTDTSFVLHNGNYGNCICLYCAGYSYGNSNCIGQTCYTYPGCYVGSVYCTGYESSSQYGCLQNKE